MIANAFIRKLVSNHPAVIQVHDKIDSRYTRILLAIEEANAKGEAHLKWMPVAEEYDKECFARLKDIGFRVSQEGELTVVDWSLHVSQAIAEVLRLGSDKPL